MSLLKILTAQNHTLFYKIILFTEKNKNILHSYFIPNIFIKFHNKFLCKTHSFLVGNNNRRGRTRPAKETVFFIFILLLLKKIMRFYILLYNLLKKISSAVFIV